MINYDPSTYARINIYFFRKRLEGDRDPCPSPKYAIEQVHFYFECDSYEKYTLSMALNVCHPSLFTNLAFFRQKMRFKIRIVL